MEWFPNLIFFGRGDDEYGGLRDLEDGLARWDGVEEGRRLPRGDLDIRRPGEACIHFKNLILSKMLSDIPKRRETDGL